ncbi:MAG TPA: FliA/WhiG family RNA polymerase sigma factor [Candidatus Angelobacter sp.]|nr:FliA/WhiG family RNA polymerase sigma factor [Candidatus Angelobacter sp.]
MATNVINPAQSQLVVQNYFNLVQAIASKIKRRLPAHVDVEDLVQTGMIGLLEASSRYDASRMVDFSSYANARITGAILDELRKWDTCSRQDRKTAREIEHVKQNLRARMGCEPAREEIAEAVGLGLIEYDRTLHRLESAKLPSMQSEDHDSDPVDEMSQIPSKDQTPYDACSKNEDFKLLRTFIKELKPKQRQVLELYYFKDMGLKEIGEKLGVGEARVSQIHKQAVTELRRIISNRTRARRATAAQNVSSMVQ